MGKITKAVKPLIKVEKTSKVKKLVNNPGVSKASAKLNLKHARGPLPNILKNGKDAKKMFASADVASFSKPVKNVLKPIAAKITVGPIMKTLKRKSDSENTMKPLSVEPTRSKKRGIPAVISIEKVKKKEVAVKLLSDKTPGDLTKTETNSKDPIFANKTEVNISRPTETPGMTENQVTEAVAAVLELAKIEAEKKKRLFDGEVQPIFLQVTCIKVPIVPTRQFRILLPHTLVTDTDDVALFVGDLRKGRRQDLEPTIQHFQDLLREHGCTQIKDVISLTQVKTEYSQYELKRRLLSSYDYFLTEGKIAGHMSHLLGKAFIAKRKIPTSIKMDKKNLKNEIDEALKKTSMYLHSHGNNHIAQVAHTGMTKQQIFENVQTACKALINGYPGGWPNIRRLVLKTASSLSVPIYLTLKCKNDVKVPIIEPRRPKAFCTVSGELSTVSGDAVVEVTPSGTVMLHKRNKTNSDEIISDTPVVKKARSTTDEKDSIEGQLNEKKTPVTGDVKKSRGETVLNADPQSSDAEDSDDDSETEINTERFEDSEDEIEDAEQAYLSQWQEESITPTTTQTTKPEKKPKNVIKKKTKVIKKKKTKA